MNSEILKETGNFINQFGFPIFFGVIALIFAYKSFKFFTDTIEQKDSDLKSFMSETSAKVFQMAENHNNSFNRNTEAINRLSESIKTRTFQSKVNTKVLKEVAHKLDELPPTGGIPKPETDFEEN